jgi:hypothetical protein
MILLVEIALIVGLAFLLMLAFRAYQKWNEDNWKGGPRGGSTA